jgi:hypothetical protein
LPGTGKLARPSKSALLERENAPTPLLSVANLAASPSGDGEEPVNSLEEKVNARTATFKDSFVDIVPSSFSFLSDGSVDGKRIWRVITKYTRPPESNQR